MPLPARGMKAKMLRLSAIALFALAHAAVAAPSLADKQRCVHPAVILWGDGRHDDTKALQAWLRGADALWGDSGAPVGATIARRVFRLSAAIYVDGGSGRTLNDFRFVWPERGETVSGGTIRTGNDPEAEPMMAGIRIVGGDPGEARPMASPPLAVPHPRDASCGIS